LCDNGRMRLKLILSVILWIANGIAATQTIKLGLKADAAVAKYRDVSGEVNELTVEAAQAKSLHQTQTYAKADGLKTTAPVYISSGL